MSVVTAEKIREFNEHTERVLWKLSEPVERVMYSFPLARQRNEPTRVEYVVTSQAFEYSTENYAFPADENGKIIDWGELPGSQRGIPGHQTVINGFLDYVNNSKVAQ